MQVSVENTSAIERRMTIEVPSGQIDSEVEKRLHKNAKSIRINGFRPGKVPMSVVRKRYGQGVRQEVIGEVMRDSYLEAIQNENLKPAGFPEFQPKQVGSGKDVAFVATFEVYPDIQLADLEGISVTQEETEVKESDIDTMIESLRKQSATWAEKQTDAKRGDKVTLDYRGEIDGNEFEGGTATGANVELGSKSMIPGFEEGLEALKAGDEKILSLTFPDDYSAENLRGKKVQFHVSISKVEEAKLPEVNEEFYAKYGVKDGGLEGFRSELKKNMAREADFAIANKVKRQIVDQIIAANQFDVPKALVKQEVDKIKQEAVQRFGIPEASASQLPDDLFTTQAETRVKTGLIFAQIVKEKSLVVSEEQMHAKIDELAASYQDPSEVRNWYMNNAEQKQQIESAVLEDAVIDHILLSASVAKQSVAYEDAVKPEAKSAEEAEEEIAED